MRRIHIRLCVPVIELKNDLLGVFWKEVIVLTQSFQKDLGGFVFPEIEGGLQLGHLFVRVRPVLVVLEFGVEVMEETGEEVMSEDPVDVLIPEKTLVVVVLKVLLGLVFRLFIQAFMGQGVVLKAVVSVEIKHAGDKINVSGKVELVFQVLVEGWVN